MIFLGVGPSLSGKTTYVKEYVLPMLCAHPQYITEGAPPDGFKYFFVDDPRSRNHREGQYPGTRYLDTNAWRRKPIKGALCCFDEADPEELFRLAYEVGDAVVVLDEIDLRLGHGQKLGYWTVKACNRGRHDGIAIVGTMRRFLAVQPIVRSNGQFFFLGNLSDPNDRQYAAKTAGVREEQLFNIPSRTFLEYRRETHERFLTKIENHRRIVVSTL